MWEKRKYHARQSNLKNFLIGVRKCYKFQLMSKKLPEKTTEWWKSHASKKKSPSSPALSPSPIIPSPIAPPPHRFSNGPSLMFMASCCSCISLVFMKLVNEVNSCSQQSHTEEFCDYYLTIIISHWRRCEYWWIVTETKSRWLSHYSQSLRWLIVLVKLH